MYGQGMLDVRRNASGQSMLLALGDASFALDIVTLPITLLLYPVKNPRNITFGLPMGFRAQLVHFYAKVLNSRER